MWLRIIPLLHQDKAYYKEIISIISIIFFLIFFSYYLACNLPFTIPTQTLLCLP